MHKFASNLTIFTFVLQVSLHFAYHYPFHLTDTERISLSRRQQLPSLRTKSRLRSSPHSDQYDSAELIQSSNSRSAQRSPSYTELAKFALPTLGIWLLQPILSLIDTSVVGISAGTTVVQLAAIGPGVAWIDSSSYLFQFMGIATTSLYVAALSSGGENSTRAAEVLSHSIFAALFFGVFLMGGQFLLSDCVIRILCGKSVESIPFALSYAKIRSLAAPFAVPTIVAQSAFLGAKDAVTPLKAVLVGAGVNIIGDILLVSVCNMGVAGAAAATTLSQILGALYLLFVAINNLPKTSRNKQFFSWEILKKYIFFPRWKDVVTYLTFCGPLFLILLVKSVLWTYTTFACSSAGAVELAAHQITINFFLFFCIFGDVVSQIAQTYMPYFLADFDSSNKSSAVSEETTDSHSNSSPAQSSEQRSLLSLPSLRDTVKKVCWIGSGIGVLNALACLALEKFGYRFITSSLEVVAKLKSVSKLLVLSVLPHTLMLALEGITIAIRDTSFHLGLYLCSAVLFIAYLTYVSKAALGVTGVWVGLVIFQWSRLGFFILRNCVALNRKGFKIRL